MFSWQLWEHIWTRVAIFLDLATLIWTVKVHLKIHISFWMTICTTVCIRNVDRTLVKKWYDNFWVTFEANGSFVVIVSKKWQQFKRPVNKYFCPVEIIFFQYGYWKKSILFSIEKTKVPVKYCVLTVIFFSSKYLILSHLRLLFLA